MKNYFNISLVLVSGFVYLSTYVPPDKLWVAGFVSYAIPAVIAINAFIFVVRIRQLKWSAAFPGLMLIAAFGYIRYTLSFNAGEERDGLRVLSYNVKVFDVYKDEGSDTADVVNIINWINDQKADVMCLQEFYNDSKSPHYNTIEKISQNNRYKYHHIPILKNRSGAEFGPVIFSRFPIINSGTLKFEEKSQNNVIFSDLLINGDTIRIYNMHLQSLHIDEDKVINTENIQSGVENIAVPLKYGFIQRAKQVRLLKKHISDINYPVILCGDLNDLPYSYAYRELNEDLKNAFVQAGNGFGFTFNGKLFFLRIDHQFYSEELSLEQFNTHREIKASDHFPVSGVYSLLK